MTPVSHTRTHVGEVVVKHPSLHLPLIPLFLLSLQTARGQSADFILVDEAGFINHAALLTILPLLAIQKSKQVHISSHVSKASWINKVGDILDESGEQAFHVISQRFKCPSHAHLPGITCSCMAVYCPQHIGINSALQELINNVTPGGFEQELTGGANGTSNKKTDVASPFTDDVVNRLLRNTVDLNSSAVEVTRFIIAVDPTFATGTQSSLGLCTIAELNNGMRVVSILG